MTPLYIILSNAYSTAQGTFSESFHIIQLVKALEY